MCMYLPATTHEDECHGHLFLCLTMADETMDGVELGEWL